MTLKPFDMRTLRFGALILLIALAVTNCKRKDDPIPEPKLQPLKEQARLQVAYDNTDVAFRFTWKTQKKMYPAGQANVGQNYPMHFHDFLKHNGTKFDRLPSGQRMDEDRITFMIDKFDSPITGFGFAGCAVSCHSGMASHHLLVNEVLDHWHWRGARSGPMGYAEDAALNNVERIRDFLDNLPTKFIRSGGDRLRENQVALSGSSHPVLVEGLPRFVFNKGKNMPGNYTIPAFFLVNANGQVMTDPYTQAPQVKDLSKNTSLLVVYQNFSFDSEDKVNSLDLGYLVWLAYNDVAHLPAHLQDETSADFNIWKTFWGSQSGITTVSAAEAKLNEVHNEWLASNKMAMVTRSVGFIYSSDQHDITSERSFNTARNEWTVVLKRKLSTGSTSDADLSGLPTGTRYTISFAMHDAGSGAISHDISMPYTLSSGNTDDLQAKKVSSLNSVNWDDVPAMDTYWVRQEVMQHFYYDWLKSGSHPGAGMLETSKCATCHTSTNANLLTPTVLQ